MSLSGKSRSRLFGSVAAFCGAALLAMSSADAGDQPVGFGVLKVTVKDTAGTAVTGAVIQLIQYEYVKAGGGGGMGHRTVKPGNGGAITMAPDINEVEDRDEDREKVRQTKKTGSDGIATFDKVASGAYRVALLHNGKIHQSQRGKIEQNKTTDLAFEQQAVDPNAKR